MPSIAVIGAQWGDEGKGKIVDFVTLGADWVVRFQGGNNAGHTLVVDGAKTTLSAIPSGILRPQARCVIAAGAVVNPSVVVAEIEKLRAAGIEVTPQRLLLDRDAHVVFEYHQAVDQERETKKRALKIGTTGRGIGPAYEDRCARVGVRLAEFLRPESLKERVRQQTDEKNRYLKDALVTDRAVDFTALWDRLQQEVAILSPFIGNASLTLHEAIARGEKVVFEGAQGVMLDTIHGTYPYVTSSHTISGAVCTGCGLGPRALEYVLGIAKGYATRVGEGPFPTEIHGPIAESIRQQGHEFGSVTGRPRRIGWLDIPALKRAARICGFSSLGITKIDVLSGISPVKICTGYKLDGVELDDIPALVEDVERIEPMYIELEGWEGDISTARAWEDLPHAAQRYLQAVSELSGAPISIVSVGPERHATLFTEHAGVVRDFVR